MGSGNPANSVLENDPGVIGSLFDNPNTTINSRGRMTFDQRVSRDFQLRSRRLSLTLDVFNLLNLNRRLTEYDVTGPLFAAHRPVDVENPRVRASRRPTLTVYPQSVNER